MSGQLVGEVIAASARLRAGGLSQNGFLGLIAIAEKCHPRTRQGSVPWCHICDGLYGVSKRTAERAVRELRAAELVEVVKPGWANQHGEAHAPIYELRIAPPVSASSKLDTDKSELDTDKSELDTDKHPPATSTDPTLNGSINGSINGDGSPQPETPPPEPPQPANPQNHPRPKTDTKALGDLLTDPRTRTRKTPRTQPVNDGATVNDRRHEEREAYKRRLEGIPDCDLCDEHGYTDADEQCWHGLTGKDTP
jgi:hypothetical protein